MNPLILGIVVVGGIILITTMTKNGTDPADPGEGATPWSAFILGGQTGVVPYAGFRGGGVSGTVSDEYLPPLGIGGSY